ncbi:MAG: hypothetical protein QW568_00015 [Candidatus Anstonellaceae archaeon]
MVVLVAELCCIAWIVTPIMNVFFSLPMGVALMKIKLQLEK